MASLKETTKAGDRGRIGLLGLHPGAPLGGLQKGLRILRSQFWRSTSRIPSPGKALSVIELRLANLRLAMSLATKIVPYAKSKVFVGRFSHLVIIRLSLESLCGVLPELAT